MSNCGIHRQRQVGDVVDDAHGEAAARLLVRKLVEHRAHHGGRELLGRQAVAPAHDARARPLRAFVLGAAQRGDHVQVERVADRARLLGAVEDGDRAGGLGQRLKKILHREGAVEAHLEHAHLLAARHHPVDQFVRRLRARAHHDDHALGLRMADVVEQVVAPPGELGEALHFRAHRFRTVVVIRVAGFARLEEHVGVLRRAAHHRMVGRQAARAVRGDRLLVDERAAGRRPRAPRSSPLRARCGSRRRSAGTECAP